MKFTANRDALLPVLQQANGIIEKKHTMPILANVLLEAKGDTLYITATDLETQTKSKVLIDNINSELDTAMTVAAEKLLRIIKALPKDSIVKFDAADNKLKLSSGKSRFTLSTLDADGYPKFMTSEAEGVLEFTASEWGEAFDTTTYCMAKQDIRYYLNGLLIKRESGAVTFVGSDGHRLSIYTVSELSNGDDMTAIVHAKAVSEIAKLLDSIDKESMDTVIALHYRRNYISMTINETEFFSKLIDSKYPQFAKVFEQPMTQDIIVNKTELKSAIQRVVILSSEKFKGITFDISDESIKLTARNPEHEQADEEVSIDYLGASNEIAFNATYFIDALSHVKGDNAVIRIAENDSCAFVTGDSEVKDDSNYVFVLMPMRM